MREFSGIAGENQPERGQGLSFWLFGNVLEKAVNLLLFGSLESGVTLIWQQVRFSGGVKLMCSLKQAREDACSGF